jgi:uncharacterized protein YjbI with pentapeptide repeats
LARFMDESESKRENRNAENRRFDPELLKKGLRCDLDQYDFLKRCSEKGEEGIKEWNDWVHKHEAEEILLDGANLFKSYLKEVLLWGAHLNGAQLGIANLEDANLSWAHMEHAELTGAQLKDAKFMYAHLECSRFGAANLEKVRMMFAYLQGTEFYESNLCGARFRLCSVSIETSFWQCEVNVQTDFRGTALSSTQVDPATKQLLEYNNRRMNWEDWYEWHPKLKWIVKPFWLMSDYGLSTGRIIVTFFSLAFFFAIIYYLCGRIAPPGIVENLFEVQKATGEVFVLPTWLVPLRTLYFSIITMTTLGFGDMYANAQSIWGHILLSLQVILGYVLLGALVTRFAVLFTAGGPAGKFAKEN